MTAVQTLQKRPEQSKPRKTVMRRFPPVLFSFYTNREPVSMRFLMRISHKALVKFSTFGIEARKINGLENIKIIVFRTTRTTKIYNFFYTILPIF